MKEPPDEALLARIAAGLDGPVEDLVRKDSQFSKLGLVEEDYVGDPAAVVLVGPSYRRGSRTLCRKVSFLGCG
jgi:hypothetical protein